MTDTDARDAPSRVRPRRAAGSGVTGAGLVLGLLTASFVIAKSARDAMYFGGGGLADLPLAYVGMALLALPVAMVTLAGMRRFGARSVRVAGPTLAGIGLSLLAGFARPGGGPVMTAVFIAIPLVFGVLFSMAWLLLAELLSGADDAWRPEAYARAGAGSLAGGVLGALVARLLLPATGPRPLFLVAAVATLSAAALLAVVHRLNRWCPRGGSRETAPRPMPFDVLRSKHVAALLSLAALGATVGVLIEFLFYTSATSAMAGRGGVVFADLYLALNATALVGQVTLLARFQQTVGLGGTLMVLPLTVAGLAPLAVLSVPGASRTLLRLAEGGLKASIHRAAWEQAFAAVEPARRARARLLADGTAARMAEGATGVGLALALRGGEVMAERLASIALVLCALAWLGASARFRGRHAPSTSVGHELPPRVPDS